MDIIHDQLNVIPRGIRSPGFFTLGFQVLVVYRWVFSLWHFSVCEEKNDLLYSTEDQSIMKGPLGLPEKYTANITRLVTNPDDGTLVSLGIIFQIDHITNKRGKHCVPVPAIYFTLVIMVFTLLKIVFIGSSAMLMTWITIYWQA